MPWYDDIGLGGGRVSWRHGVRVFLVESLEGDGGHGLLSLVTLNSYPSSVTLKVDFDREEDGRWIALVESIPGCHVYGKTRQEALTKVEALALHAIAEKLEDGEVTAEEAANVIFVVSAAA